jgi:BirA family biotin operon repressor/biotin-[acetyl-CoA-carboxylase] ligase
MSLAQSGLEEALAPIPWITGIHFFETLESTSQRARQMARDGAPAGTLVVADGQSGGHGRKGRPWFSPPGVNLYFSVVLHPTGVDPQHIPLITLMAGVALCRGLQPLLGPHRATLKWPNDVLIDGRKVAGILTEMSTTGRRVDYAILGIGINVNQPVEMWPPDLQSDATSIYAATGEIRPRAHILFQVLSHLGAGYAHLQRGERAECIAAWKRVSSTLGKPVRIRCGTEELTGIARDLDAAGALVIEQADGTWQTVSAGEMLA